jgi:two-component system KDP operon response regulator KdpE
LTTVLLVDDEPSIHRFLRPALAAEGYDVVPANDGREALSLAAQRAPDVVILDLGLPDIDGKVVLRRLRAWSDVPIVVLSARDREAEKVEALDLGADDFVNKPFGVGELFARLRAALRKHRPGRLAPGTISVGRCEIDLAGHRVLRNGVDVHLTRREFDLLALLARNAGTVMTHRQLLTAVWGPSHSGDTQYLRVYVGQIRQKLGDAAGESVILTEPGIGYRIAAKAD